MKSITPSGARWLRETIGLLIAAPVIYAAIEAVRWVW